MEAPAAAASPVASGSKSTPNAQLLDRFYDAFAKKDWETVAACYHPEAQFSDPVFPSLSRNSVVAMWRMFCENKTSNLEVSHSNVKATNDEGSANWEAKYIFQGQHVHNKIQANFTFRDGKIYRHTDHFDLWTWTSQALGWTGYFLGWTGFLQDKVRATAAGRLKGFIEKHPEYQDQASSKL